MSAESLKTPLGMVAAAFGLFAGLASLVVILGGAVLSWRLRSQGLPADAVVSVLPREFLISVGLGVTVQLVVFLLVLLPGFVWQGAGVARAAAWAGAALLAYPFLRIASGYDWLLLGAAWLVTAFILYGFILWGRRKWGSTRETLPIVSLVIVGLAFFIPWRAAFEWRSAPGLDALVCLVGSEGFAGEFPVGWADGVLIGENNNYIYIGQKKRSGGRDPQIAQIPREHIGIVVVGEDADLQEGEDFVEECQQQE